MLSMTNISNLLVTGVEHQSPEVLMVVLPIVGISVVISSLAFLAVILKYLILVNKEARKSIFTKSKVPVLEEKNIQKKDDETKDKSFSEDEIVAVATAIYLVYQKSSDPIALTEIPFDSSQWVSAGRNAQSSAFNNWKTIRTR